MGSSGFFRFGLLVDKVKHWWLGYIWLPLRLKMFSLNLAACEGVYPFNRNNSLGCVKDGRSYYEQRGLVWGYRQWGEINMEQRWVYATYARQVGIDEYASQIHALRDATKFVWRTKYVRGYPAIIPPHARSGTRGGYYNAIMGAPLILIVQRVAAETFAARAYEWLDTAECKRYHNLKGRIEKERESFRARMA